jgi:hypothetical protein
MVQGVLAAGGAEVIADRLLGQDDGAYSAWWETSKFSIQSPKLHVGLSPRII